MYNKAFRFPWNAFLLSLPVKFYGLLKAAGNEECGGSH